MPDHTFLFKEGLWRSEGEFVDALGKRAAVQGEAHIRHYPDRWVYEGVLRTLTSQPVVSHVRRPTRQRVARYKRSGGKTSVRCNTVRNSGCGAGASAGRRRTRACQLDGSRCVQCFGMSLRGARAEGRSCRFLLSGAVAIR